MSNHEEPTTGGGRRGIDNTGKYPRAQAFLEAYPKAALLDWIMHSEIGRNLLAQLERKLGQR